MTTNNPGRSHSQQPMSLTRDIFNQITRIITIYGKLSTNILLDTNLIKFDCPPN